MKALLDWLYHISPQLVAVVIGGILVQRFFVSRANEAVWIDRLIKELDQLRSDSLDYWNLEYGKTGNDDAKVKAQVLEQKIKGSIRSLNAELRHYSAKHRKTAEEFSEIMGAVLDACTGGDFESEKRKRDRQRYLIIVNIINDVKSKLLRGKL